MQDPFVQPDRFKPEMPNIPGVPAAHDAGLPATGAANTKSPTRLLIVAAACAVIVLVGWGALRASRSKTNAHASADPSGEPLPAVASDEFAGDKVPAQEHGPMVVATLAELASPWSKKAFTFTNPVTHDSVPAMIIRLPGTSAERSSGYWAFSLNAPYVSCDLEYVTDFGKLAAKYDYRAKHPMVLAPCDGTIYDPLNMATAPTGAWVRGEIVQGVGIRPPLAIEIQVKGDTILASSME